MQIGDNSYAGFSGDLFGECRVVGRIQKYCRRAGRSDLIDQGGDLFGRGRCVCAETFDYSSADRKPVALSEISQRFMIGDKQPALEWDLSNLLHDPGVQIL